MAFSMTKADCSMTVSDPTTASVREAFCPTVTPSHKTDRETEASSLMVQF